MSRIVVELTDRVTDAIAERARDGKADLTTLRDVAKELKLGPLSALLTRYENPDSKPLIRKRTTSDLLASRRGLKATSRTSPSCHAFVGFYVIEANPLEQPKRKQLLEELRGLKRIVASASFEPTVAASSVVAAPVYRVHQDYLKAAEWGGVGIDALEERLDGTGSGVAALDVGWNLEHEALEHLGTPVSFPPGLVSDSHGTGVLGIMVGRGKIEGIAPGATVKALLRDVPEESLVETIYDLLNDAGADGDVLAYGDVLLIEVAAVNEDEGIEGLPLEVHADIFRAIQWAVSLGIVVIAVAGNGHTVNGDSAAWDLDQVAKNSNLAPGWRREKPSRLQQSLGWLSPWKHAESKTPHSGAIIVSGCGPILHTQNPPAFLAWPTHNFGSRVDCYGWGSGVMTIGRDSPPPRPDVLRAADENEYYTDRFNGTSAAAAIVAGIVLVVQQMARHELKEALSPGQMQALLRDHSMGTPVYRDNRVVGVLPDLAKLHAALRRLPRLHVRAFIGDSGEIPVAREKMSVDAQSPDIFVCARGHPHPDLKYGSPNASPDTVPTVDPIRPGTRSALYIRVRNQGDAPAENLRAAAYWAEHLHDPDEPALWHAVDETKCPPLPQGNGYVIVGPLDLELSKRVRPSTGKIDIIVAVGGDLDPRPNLPPAEGSKQVLSRNKLLPFLQSSANVAMRCVEVVSGKPA